MHKTAGRDTGQRTIELLDPVENNLVARVRNVAVASYNVIAGDEVVFTYTTTAPETDGEYPFHVLFKQAPVEGNTSVRVQSTSATKLALTSLGTVSADTGAPRLAITVSLQDDADVGRVSAAAVPVTLRSNSATGAFSATVDGAGTAPITVDIPDGEPSVIVHYSDSIPGTATITATATGLTPATPHMVTVMTDMVEIVEGSVTVSSTIAKDGDTVTVTAMATAGQRTAGYYRNSRYRRSDDRVID